MAIDLTDPISGLRRTLVLVACAAGVAGLTVAERYLSPAIPLGALFFLPLLVAAAFVPRWMIFILAIALAVAREQFGPLSWDRDSPARLALSMVAFTGGALFAGELVRNRRITMALLRKTQEGARVRSDAEQEARALVETSPAAVLTVDPLGNIAMANEAARQMLGFSDGSPEGHAVDRYIPLLGKIRRSKQTVRVVRTMIEANGHRSDGEAFFSQMWVSAYDSASGPRLAAIIADATEQLRDREELGLRQLLSSSKIIAGAVSHEIRNLTGAAAVLHHNLAKWPGIQTSPDFEALGKVIEGVLKLSTGDVADEPEDALDGVNASELLEELRMIISPMFEDSAATLTWEIAQGLPHLRVNHSGLLQVFINLAQNSRRVLENVPGGRLRITAYEAPGSVVIRFVDNGPGISAAERLFQPFHPGASSTGLGLFISRAIIRTFGGELHHTQRTGECCFIIELPAIAAQEPVGA